ncbi:MAG: response regulator [Mucilaginibacter sp.]
METIMIQEPDGATLDVVSTALRMNGYRIYSVADRNENILEMIRGHHPKLVLLDCWLSKTSGRQIAHWIKAHFPRLPVIAFSCDDNIAEEYRRLGFDGYLKKPFDIDVLYNLIDKHLHRRKRQISEHA